MDLNLIDNNKIRADDYSTILIIPMYLLFAIFFTLEAILSLIAYQLVALAVAGIIKIVNCFKKNTYGNLNKFLLGIIYITFGVLLLNYLLIQPNITPNVIITLIAFPMSIVGITGIIKGILIEIYSEKYRVVNILVGIVTLIIVFMAFASTEKNFIIYILTLSTILLINILSRAALYLSEFGLSLFHLKNFKLFFYIISDYLLHVDDNGNIVVSKME